MRRRQCRGTRLEDCICRSCIPELRAFEILFGYMRELSALFGSDCGGGKTMGIVTLASGRLLVRPIGFITWLLIFLCVFRFLISCGRAILTNMRSIGGVGIVKVCRDTNNQGRSGRHMLRGLLSCYIEASSAECWLSPPIGRLSSW